MKITKSLILLIICTSFGFSQDVDDVNLQSAINDLNEEQQLEFFRTKITIEPASGFFGKITYRNWNAFQGLDKKLSTKEFFSITGYEAEAPDFALRTELPWLFFAYTGITLGLVGITIVEEGGSDGWDEEGNWNKETTDDKRPLLLPGIIFLGGGAYSLYYYITHPQLTTYELAREIASAYNNKLIVWLKNQ